jgi:aspartate aminotransferase
VIHKITEIAKDYRAIVLSDEIYEYLIYEGEHYSPGSEYDNVITVNGFAKSHAICGGDRGSGRSQENCFSPSRKFI